MLKDFDIVHDMDLNCMEIVLVSLLNWYKLPYKPIFALSWNFSFKESNSRISSCLETGQNNIFYALTKYCGMILDDYKVTKKKALRIIKKNIDKNIPVILSTSIYWCPWHRYYKRYSYEHMTIITGINFKKEVLYCIDKDIFNIFNEPAILPFSDYYNGYNAIMTCKPEKAHREVLWDEFIILALLNLNTSPPVLSLSIDTRLDFRETLLERLKNESGKYIEDLYKLVGCLCDSKYINNEKMNGLDLKHTPFYRKLIELGSGRRNFSLALGYFSEISGIPELKEFGNKLEGIGWFWHGSNLHFINEVFARENTEYQAIKQWADQVKSIIKYEMDLLDEIINFVLNRIFSDSRNLDKNKCVNSFGELSML